MRAISSSHLNIYNFIHLFIGYCFKALDFDPTKA